MSKKKEPRDAAPEQAAEQTAEQTAECAAATEVESLQAALAEQQDTYLRLAAEYDNYRKRTIKEKESIWADARAQTAAALLPVFDNLERAVRQETEDKAYAKGVEMTMTQLREIFERIGITEIKALGASFDPELHSAVMHIEDPELGENIVSEVYQTGFIAGDKVIRHATVVVAN